MKYGTKTIFNVALALVVSAFLAGCAGDSSNPYEVSDPFEGTNRAIFSFNNAVDHAVINPTIRGYRAVVPRPARNGVNNFLINLNEILRVFRKFFFHFF